MRQGKLALRIEVDETRLIEALVAANLLSPSIDHDRPQLQAAVERLLVLMIAEAHV